MSIKLSCTGSPGSGHGYQFLSAWLLGSTYEFNLPLRIQFTAHFHLLPQSEPLVNPNTSFNMYMLEKLDTFKAIGLLKNS
jgi:hypothetical protein